MISGTVFPRAASRSARVGLAGGARAMARIIPIPKSYNPGVRYQELPSSFIARLSLQPAAALRRRLRQGYRRADLTSDVLAGIVVAMVALPLGMALAVASGVAPQHGLYTVVIAGFVVALLGGSK